MKKGLWSFLFSENGATSIEYALIAGLLFLAIVVAVSDLGTSVVQLYQKVAENYPQ